MWETKSVFVGDAVSVSEHANSDILTSGVRVRHREKQGKLTTTPAAARGNHRGKPPS